MTNNLKAEWSLQNWLDYLEAIQPIKYNLRLENVRQVASNLEVIDFPIPVVTVGGTNGKGSTVAALTAIYSAAGYRVGHFTSPHLIKFNERICINNQQISDEDAARLLLLIDNCKSDIEISYFEAALLCALLYFTNNKVDLIVLEVGMGGRLDATNIIDADLTIITSIALDHQKYLGNDTFAIGREKAGIMRGERECIFADDLRPASIDEYAKLVNANLICLGQEYNFTKTAHSFSVYYKNFMALDLPKVKINPKAAAAAVIATYILRDKLPVSPQALIAGVANIVIYGRQQVIYHGTRKLILDVSHNPHGVLSLVEFVEKIQPKASVHAIFSGLADKDLEGMVAPFFNKVNKWYPVILQSKRAASSENLQSAFKAALGIENMCLYADIATAYQEVICNYKESDLVIIYGSFLLVGAFMHKFTREINYV